MLRTSVRKNGVIEYFIDNAPSWDDFDSLIKFFEKYHSATVLEKIDGVFIRIYKLKINNFEFYLKHHEDIGNYFYSFPDKNQDKLIAISQDLSKRLD